jgi:hypothetical protein
MCPTLSIFAQGEYNEANYTVLVNIVSYIDYIPTLGC